MTAYIYDGLRSPFGRHAGALASVRPDDLLASVMSALIKRNPFEGKDYEDVIMGCTNQAGEDARNIARHAGLMSGLPQECPLYTPDAADVLPCVDLGGRRRLRRQTLCNRWLQTHQYKQQQKDKQIQHSTNKPTR